MDCSANRLRRPAHRRPIGLEVTHFLNDGKEESVAHAEHVRQAKQTARQPVHQAAHLAEERADDGEQHIESKTDADNRFGDTTGAWWSHNDSRCGRRRRRRRNGGNTGLAFERSVGWRSDSSGCSNGGRKDCSGFERHGRTKLRPGGDGERGELNGGANERELEGGIDVDGASGEVVNPEKTLVLHGGHGGAEIANGPDVGGGGEDEERGMKEVVEGREDTLVVEIEHLDSGNPIPQTLAITAEIKNPIRTTTPPLVAYAGLPFEKRIACTSKSDGGLGRECAEHGLEQRAAH
jgi:hypothetical protein